MWSVRATTTGIVGALFPLLRPPSGALFECVRPPKIPLVVAGTDHIGGAGPWGAR